MLCGITAKNDKVLIEGDILLIDFMLRYGEFMGGNLIW